MIDQFREQPLEALSRFFPPESDQGMPYDLPIDDPRTYLDVPALRPRHQHRTPTSDAHFYARRTVVSKSEMRCGRRDLHPFDLAA